MFFISCATRRPEVVLDTNATSPEMLIALVERQSEKLQTLTGYGTLSFESPQMSGTASFASSMRRPDSLLVTLEGPFGIDVGTLFLSRDRYVVYNSLENRVTTGVPTSGAIRSVIPFDMTYEQIVNAFAGVFSFPPEAYAGVLAVDEGEFLLSYTVGTTGFNYWVDPAFLLVTRFQQKSADGDILIEASCSSLMEDDDATAPKRIVMRFPRENRRLSINYSSLLLNEPNPSFAFSIPKTAETIER
ncbi:MAG: DUF4292 domain-containing protein [Bacteroidota bacterium]